MNDDFDDIRLRDLVFFDRLCALGSITATAAELGIPKATASRWLAQLEERVGHTLVARTTRRSVLTERGRAFGEHVREVLAAARQAKQAVRAEVPGGTLRASLPVPMGRMLAGPVIGAFRQQMPGVKLDIRLQNARVDLLRERFDVVIRGGPLGDSELIARKLSVASMWLYTSALYEGQELSTIPLIAAPGDAALLGRTALGSELGDAAVVVDDRTAVADALVWGAGAGLLPAFIGEPPRSRGELVRLGQEPAAVMDVHALFHASSRDDPRTVVFVELIAAQLNRVL